MDERMKARMDRTAQSIGQMIGGTLPKGVGFCLSLFTFDAPGWMTYVSSAERQGTVKRLEELLAHLKANSPKGLG